MSGAARVIRVVTADERGRLAGVARALGDAGVAIHDIDADTSFGIGLIHVVAEPYDAALAALRAAGFDAVAEEVVVARLHDEPGSLARAAGRLAEAGIDVRTMRILGRRAGVALVGLATSDDAAARAVLDHDAPEEGDGPAG